tara:strand:- start:938 stop:1855 length:918 start_codon:yes stop_codon:yes gene_type:complete
LKKKIYKVIIIGLGRAGAIFNIKKNKFFSHAQAISQNKRFKLVAGVDLRKEKTVNFSKKFNTKTYLSLNKMVKNEKFDIAIISVPTEKQFIVSKNLINLVKNKTILCEKPGTDNLKKIKELKKISKRKRIKFYINFQRNSLKSSHVIKKIILNNSKNLINVTYSKGVLNSASHYIALFLSFFSNKYSKVLKYKNFKSENKKDFLSKFTVLFNKQKVNFIPKLNYKKIHGAIQISNKKFNLKYLRGGRKIFIINNSSKKIKEIKSDIQKSQIIVYNELIKKLEGKKSLLCSIDNTINTLTIIKKIK